ncbi:TetR/AcrR family transcriptional regulator [Streptomyces sp. NPDC050504]|uniref:TetR/AcrR family transcriptional regulator n=1 Tax=Streptomyces sp. NPDC050504 TaxID=3365618 RepID=UPI003796EAD3
MARPRTFDEERALDAAMRAFWRNGYEATSTQELCEATGLGRSSIYNTFSSKRDLFLRALARYADSKAALQLALLEDGSVPPLERIRALFAAVVDGEFEERIGGRSIGCLTVNTVVEQAGRADPEPEVVRLLERDLRRRLDALRAVVAEGQRDGSIATGRAPADVARYLNAVIGGMRVSAQGGAGREVLESTAEIAVDALAR